MVDWVTISALATAGGTLVLAAATFASVRSANRAARVAEELLLAGIRPLLMPSRPEDPPVKVGFADDHIVLAPGAGAPPRSARTRSTSPCRCATSATASPSFHGWRVDPSRVLGESGRPDVSDFRRLTRDIYVAAGDVAFWQGAFREPTEPEFADVSGRITAPERIGIDLLYGDHQGRQRVISRFLLSPREDGRWLASVSRHWNVDRPDPR